MEAPSVQRTLKGSLNVPVGFFALIFGANRRRLRHPRVDLSSYASVHVRHLSSCKHCTFFGGEATLQNRALHEMHVFWGCQWKHRWGAELLHPHQLIYILHRSRVSSLSPPPMPCLLSFVCHMFCTLCTYLYRCNAYFYTCVTSMGSLFCKYSKRCI